MRKLLLIALLGAAAPATLQAAPADRDADIFGPSAPRAESIAERNMREAPEIAARIERERVREEMRDTSHDGRLPVGKDTSLGVGRGGINVLVTY
ncbi:hypothetical protein [Porphyrobacter sp. AAP82]|uniref:hypothetical protein n=1 Tax=Porphyrobacter sp. AAP82 TaxID=1248917 RepID=UPI0002F1ABD9|nr:hypothetical protein [Porphyrobacter sp. AAP82]